MLFKLILITLVVVDVESAYRRVCYYTNWSQYRNGPGKYFPENVDPTLCTHLIYTFAKLVGNKLTAYEWNDESTPWMKGMYARFNDLKNQNPSLKTLLAVGGWTMASRPFTAMVATDASRRQFAATTVTFLRAHNFDGLDLDWEYPANRGSPPGDKQKYIELLRILRQEFDSETKISGKPKLILSAAVPAGKPNIDAGYNVPEMVKNLDMINLMTYDLHGSWESITGHNSGLFQHSSDTGNETHLNGDWVATYYQQLGVPPSMINFGMATYGRSFTLRDPNQHDIGSAVTGPGTAGPYSREKGFLSYYEICEVLKSGGTRHYLTDQMVPYVVKGSQWIGYEDVDSITTKVKYVKQQGFGGTMIWALDLDDFKGLCGHGNYPLLHAIVDELNKPGGTVVKPVFQHTQAPSTKKPTTQVQTPAPTQAQTHQPTHAPVTTASVSSTTILQNQLGTSNFNCAGKASGFYPNPSACDSYFICAGSMSFQVHCANGLLYNVKSRFCDWPRNVQCSINPQSASSTAIPKTTKAPSTYNPFVTNAPVQTTTTTQAPVQTHTPTLYPYYTVGPLVTQKPVQTNAPVVTNAPIVTNAPVVTTPGPYNANFCQNKPDGLYRDSQACGHFYQCNFGLTFHEPCAPGLVFNENNQNCDYIFSVPACHNFRG